MQVVDEAYRNFFSSTLALFHIFLNAWLEVIDNPIKRPWPRTREICPLSPGTAPPRSLNLSTRVGRGFERRQKSRIKVHSDLEWHIQVAFDFAVSRCLHDMLCTEIVFALNTRCPANNAGSSRALCEWGPLASPRTSGRGLSAPVQTFCLYARANNRAQFRSASR